jgi:acyl-CoA reductase-like NAD-dependent aldehyde dehydrogenase
MARKLKVYSPIDGSLYLEREFASEDVLKGAIESAKQAQQEWRNTALSERQAICLGAVEALLNNSETIADELSWQMGRPIRYAAGELRSLADRARYMVSVSDECLGSETLDEKTGFTRYIKKNPVGVVAVIAPWNYPLHTPINAIIPALLAGNAVLLKHSAQTPLCAERIVEAFIDAGLPEGVFQYLHLSHASTEQLIKHKNISAVTFTGSVEAGKTIESACAGRFINLGLELGGKDPAYVRADADLDYSVESTVDGAFFNSGQSCCAIERLYVHKDVYDTFVPRFVELVKSYVLGGSNDSKTTLGPLVKTSAAAFVRKQVAEAIAQGAKAEIDAGFFDLDEVGTAYIGPQVLTGVNHDMAIMREETFGPAIGIMKVESDAEAVALMNDSDLGLSAAIFSQDVEVSVSLGEQIETGTFFVNRCDYLDPELAWTGVKDTGRGASLSKFGFDNFIQLKSFHIKHV